jgi:uncharacterized protein (TIGR03083 family)
MARAMAAGSGNVMDRDSTRLRCGPMRPAAEILLLEQEALRPVLDAADPRDFARQTICDGWSVRDVLAHCAAALTHAVQGTVHDFSPGANQRDVEQRRSWTLGDVLEELYRGYHGAAHAIHAAGGALDGIGIGEWIHGGDVREALGAPDAYASAGVELAVELLVERSILQGKKSLVVTVGGVRHSFGVDEDPVGTVLADEETFVRLCGGRRPDPDRYELDGCTEADLLLFS